MKKTKNLPIFISFLGDREGVATGNFNFSLFLGGSNFALRRGIMFWGVSLWHPPRIPPLAHVWPPASLVRKYQLLDNSVRTH